MRVRVSPRPLVEHTMSYIVTVYHGFYGCDSGCCGTRFDIYENKDNQIDSVFSFSHAETLEEAQEIFSNEIKGTWRERNYFGVQFEIEDLECWLDGRRK